MNFFFKLKAWQMFLLIIGPMILPIFVIHGPSGFKWFGVLTFLWMIIIIGWLYSVGSAANKRLSEELRKDPFLYRLGFALALIYGILIAGYVFPNLELSNKVQPFPAWLVPLHLASMFGMLYGFWFTAKQFVTLQKGESVKFIDYSGQFFLFCLSPIGVWFLQPIIHEVFGSNGKEPESGLLKY